MGKSQEGSVAKFYTKIDFWENFATEPFSLTKTRICGYSSIFYRFSLTKRVF